jgi:hypothetical protein
MRRVYGGKSLWTTWPRPNDTPSVENHPRIVRRPEGAWPNVPKGFEVTEFATQLVIVRVPKGDSFKD